MGEDRQFCKQSTNFSYSLPTQRHVSLQKVDGFISTAIFSLVNWGFSISENTNQITSNLIAPLVLMIRRSLDVTVYSERPELWSSNSRNCEEAPPVKRRDRFLCLAFSCRRIGFHHDRGLCRCNPANRRVPHASSVGCWRCFNLRCCDSFLHRHDGNGLHFSLRVFGTKSGPTMLSADFWMPSPLRSSLPHIQCDSPRKYGTSAILAASSLSCCFVCGSCSSV
ncbi:MAG: hypothetical protein RI957_1139 [Verrucomicrobiota bacterium]|jgi:hypothetical protein